MLKLSRNLNKWTVSRRKLNWSMLLGDESALEAWSPFLSALSWSISCLFLSKAFWHGGLFCFPGTQSLLSAPGSLFASSGDLWSPFKYNYCLWAWHLLPTIEPPMDCFLFVQTHYLMYILVLCYVSCGFGYFAFSAFLFPPTSPFPPFLCPPRCYFLKRKREKVACTFLHLCFDINNCYW